MISAVVVLAVLAIVIWLVMTPLRAAAPDGPTSDRDALEAAKEAKYTEIRDAELDYRTGKLSEDDWRALDRGLRAEAIDLLDAIERLDG